jgi:hypothetical protein
LKPLGAVTYPGQCQWHRRRLLPPS